MDPQNAPIGYWIKQADRVLTDGINAIQASFYFTRTDWQLLNTIQEADSISRSTLLIVIEPFADEIAVETILCRFIADGLVASPDETTFLLTQKGKNLHKDCLKAQLAFRQTAVSGITDDAYLTTVSTLRQLVANLTTT